MENLLPIVPDKPIVTFEVEKRDDGSFLCAGENVLLLHYVIRNPLGDSMNNYDAFLKLCREMLNRNGTPAGELLEATPWEEVAVTGHGIVKFATP